MKVLVFLLVEILLCGLSPGQYHPYGDRDGAPRWPHSFGEKLHYLCSGRTGLEESEQAMLRTLLPEFEKNYGTVVEIQNLAPRDRYLGRILGFVRDSGLSKEKKHERYREAYERCLRETDRNDTLAQLLSQTGALTREEIKTHLESDNRYVRLAAEGAMRRLYVRERPGLNSGSGEGHARTTGQGGGQESQDTEAGRYQSRATTWSAVGGGLVILVAIGWWLMTRLSRRVR